MGAHVDGWRGLVCGRAAKVVETQRLALYMCGRKFVTWRLGLVTLGRLSRLLEFRRPLMGVLNDVWQLSGRTSGCVLTSDMVTELITAVGLLPMAFTDVRAAVSGMATVSHASEAGGGVCASTGVGEAARSRLANGAADAAAADLRSGLQLAGADASRAARRCRVEVGGARLHLEAAMDVRVLVFSIGDGLGRACLAAARCGFVVRGFVSVDGERSGRRVARLRWPGLQEWPSAAATTDGMLETLAEVLGGFIDHVLVVCSAGMGGDVASSGADVVDLICRVRAVFEGRVDVVCTGGDVGDAAAARAVSAAAGGPREAWRPVVPGDCTWVCCVWPHSGAGVYAKQRGVLGVSEKVRQSSLAACVTPTAKQSASPSFRSPPVDRREEGFNLSLRILHDRDSHAGERNAALPEIRITTRVHWHPHGGAAHQVTGTSVRVPG